MQWVELSSKFSEISEPNEQDKQSPWYLDLSKKVGTQLRIDQLKNQSIPELSKISSISDLLDNASEVSRTMWEEAMTCTMDTVFSQYSPKSQAGRDFITSLSDKESIFGSLANNRNWQFESLRKQGDPEIWYGLVLALSEREQLKAKLLEQWVADMTPDDEVRWGMSKLELQIYAGLNLELQPNIDNIYVKQMQISDSGMSWSKNPPEYASTVGSASIYIIQEDGIERKLTYQDVFPEEVGNMKKAFDNYGLIIARGVADKRLSSAYQALPIYLSRLSASLSIGKTDPTSDIENEAYFKSIYDAGEADEEMCAALAMSGCPIIVNPSGFIGEAGERIDMELMVGIMLGSKSVWYHDGQNLSRITADFLTTRGLPPESLVPILHQRFLAVNGSNITYTSLASSGGFINFNDGRHLEVGRDRYSRYGNFVKNSMSLEKFIEAIAIGTMTHEDGHLVMFLDDFLSDKMGASIDVDKLEELKADTVGAILFQELLHRGQTDLTASEYIEQFLLNYIDDILDAPDPTIDKSPVWYAFDIKTMMVHLLEAKAINFIDGQFQILDGEAGVSALADLGIKILDFYNDPEFGPKEAGEFVANMEHRAAHNPQIQQFLLKLNTLH